MATSWARNDYVKEATLSARIPAGVLVAIRDAVDGLEGSTDGLEALLTEIKAQLAAELSVQSGGADLATQTTTAAVLAKLSADPATQATLAAVLAKLSADPATQTSLAAAVAHLATLVSQTDGLEGFTDNLESLLTTLGTYVDGLEALLGPSAATALPAPAGRSPPSMAS